ncbi:MAG: hypothetical protein US66_C0016G0023 [Candidatus Moranbacteria bacterium GW2011_GWD2_37_9]|nr:MAG: hypothetical protein US66_C0016G0023 [Candidatus Moranbacteria bacterium GW2011_GWD2_37_9]
MKKIIIIVATIAFCALLSSCASLQKQTSAIGSNFDAKYSGEEISLSFGWSKNPEKEMAGYIISYGTKSKEYDRFIVVNSGELEDPENPHVVIYYFSIAAFVYSCSEFCEDCPSCFDVCFNACKDCTKRIFISDFPEDEIIYNLLSKECKD